MKQLFVLITLSVALGSTVGLPAPGNNEVQELADTNTGTDDIHEVERRAVSGCKI